MRRRMSRGLYWFLGIVCASLLLVFVGSGYSVHVNDAFVIDYFPEDEADGLVLRDTLLLGMQVKGVEAYADLRGAAAGRAAGRFFVARPDKTVSTYDDYASWLTACQRLDPTFQGKLVQPSRFRNPKLAAVYLSLAALLVLWLLVGYQRWQVKKRQEKTTVETG